MNKRTGAAGGRPARPRRVTVLAALATALAAAVLAACSGSSHSSGPGTSAAQTTANAMNALAQCMRGHGQANFYYANPRSVANSSGPVFSLTGGYQVTGVQPQSPQFASAMGSCKHLLPKGVAVPPTVTKQQLDNDVKFAQCMHAHGFPSYPEPDLQNGHLIQQPLPGSIDTSSPQFQAAETACGE
jgi:hypothetical protein